MNHRRGVRPAWTLLEMLVVLAILGLLVSLLIPAVQAARGTQRALSCQSNLRQIGLAMINYGIDHGYFPVAAADVELMHGGRHRWHGVRAALDPKLPFDFAESPLAPYLDYVGAIKRCPDFVGFSAIGGFEVGTGGYGYNQAYVGGTSYKHPNPQAHRFASRVADIASPTRTIAFTDAALAKEGRLIEYSFSEPVFWVDNWTPTYRETWMQPDPSIHFRHRGRANVAWCDGHVSAHSRTRTVQSSAVYSKSSPAALNLGWFGPTQDNRLFSHEETPGFPGE